MSFAAAARKVMGLPEPAVQNKAAGAGRRGGAAAPPESVNPWESAGAELRRQQPPSPALSAVAPASPPTTPWVPQDERSGAVLARRFGRGLLWFVLVLAVVTGVRSWIVPPRAPASKPVPVKSAAAYPDEEAQAVAARFARVYLGFDEANAAGRAALLASVLPAGTDTTMGWDGHGHQDVLAVQPGAVTPGRDHQARVRVDVLIRPVVDRPPAKAKGKGKAKAAPAVQPARWVGLDVPVVATAGRVVVTGEPGLVGIPAHGPEAPDLPAAQTDPELSAQTESTVDRFFAAYAGGDTDAVTAPGASVPALPAGVEYKGLVAWSADSGSGDDRTGTARVSWLLGGATVEQDYLVTITRVSTSDAARWQVSNVLGGSP